MNIYNYPLDSKYDLFDTSAPYNHFISNMNGVSHLGNPTDFKDYNTNPDFALAIPKQGLDIFYNERVEIYNEKGELIWSNQNYFDGPNSCYFIYLPTASFKDKYFWVYLQAASYPPYEMVDRKNLTEVQQAAIDYATKFNTKVMIVNRIFRQSW